MPFGAHGGGKDTVFGFWEGGEGVLDVAFEAGVCGFEDGEIVEAGVDLEGFVLRSLDDGGLDFGAAAHECAGVGLVVDGEMLPHGAFDSDGGGGDLRVAA